MSAMWREADMAGETVTTAADSAIRHLFEAVNCCQIGGWNMNEVDRLTVQVEVLEEQLGRLSNRLMKIAPSADCSGGRFQLALYSVSALRRWIA